jgi:serine/threonine-protein kinase
VAVKLLRPDLAHDEAAAKRFAREAKSAFRLDHPHSVRIFDFGFDSEVDAMYLAMEYLDGRTVADELQIDGPLSGARAAHVLAQVCAVLERAHDAGMVHRDLKPDNLMLLRRDGDPDFVKVLDFGLAKLYEPDSAGTTLFSMAAAVTQDGTVFGTPEYMSPEQASGVALDPRTDLYSAGVVLYEMLTGVLPFEGATFMATLTKHVREPPVPPARRRPDLGIAPELDALVLRCMAKRREDRPHSARQLRGELERLASQLRSRPSRVPAGLAASETMDLSGSELGRAALGRLPTVASGPVATEPPAAAPTTSDLQIDGGRRAPLGWLAAAAVAIAAAAVAIALVGRGGDPAEPARQPVAAGPATDAAATVAADSPTAPGSPADAGPADAGPTDAGPADARPRAPADRDGPPAAARRRARVARHLSRASEARRSGNTLKEIAELDAALKLAPRNREAAYRLGSALLRSGDKTRGCRYLQRARGLAKAAARAREAGCAD